jgi:hypothetical protein
VNLSYYPEFHPKCRIATKFNSDSLFCLILYQCVTLDTSNNGTDSVQSDTASIQSIYLPSLYCGNIERLYLHEASGGGVLLNRYRWVCSAPKIPLLPKWPILTSLLFALRSLRPHVFAYRKTSLSVPKNNSYIQFRSLFSFFFVKFIWLCLIFIKFKSSCVLFFYYRHIS